MGFKRKINKEVVVESLIDTSIELFFTLKDPISIHVLSSSANVILTDLLKLHGIDTFLERFIKKDSIKEWHRIERESYNFMKHADNDPKRELLFSEEKNIGVLFLCIIKFKIIYQRDSENMRLFFVYFTSKYPDILSHPVIQEIKNNLKVSPLSEDIENEFKVVLWSNKACYSSIPVPLVR